MSSEEKADSWDKLRGDAAKDCEGYWGCESSRCQECPAEADGKTPMDRYGVATCERAARLDVLARAERLAGCDIGATQLRQRCDTCRWWERHYNGAYAPLVSDGRCCRHPQSVAKRQSDWCGEWVGR